MPDIYKDEKSENVSNEGLYNISNLPVEIISLVFSHLEFYDRKNASICCKRWRYVFLDSSFLKTISIKANNNLFTARPLSSQNSLTNLNQAPRHRASSAMALSSYSSSSFSSFNLYLYTNAINLEFFGDSADVALFLKNLGYKTTMQESKNVSLLPKLETLRFFQTTMSSKTLISLLNEVPYLNQLEIINCDSLFMTGFVTIDTAIHLENLTTISFSKNRYLTDFLLNLFIDGAPNLISVDLSFCTLTKTKFKSIDNTKQINGSSNVMLTLENLIDRLNKNTVSLNLGGIEMFNHNELSLISIVSKLPNLQELHLSNLPSLKSDTICKIFEKLPKLRLIDLNNSIQECDFNLQLKSVEYLFKESVNEETMVSQLETIKLNKAKINNPRIIAEQISYFKSLRHLDLSCAMFKSSFGNTKRLNEYIEKFANGLSACGQLEALLLSYCDFLVNDAFIKIISKSLIRLNHLDLRNCSKITDVSLHFISFYLKNIIHLDISWCQNISDNGLNCENELEATEKLLLEFENYSCSCTKKYKEQPFLLLKVKSELSSETRQHFCNCPTGLAKREKDATEGETNEEMLPQEFNREISDMNSQVFSLKCLKNLKILKMESCVNITDKGLSNGIELFQLRELDIKLCTNITGDFINQVELNGSRILNNLKTLNLNQCILFKQENLCTIIKNSPNLRELNLSAISLVTNDLIDVLLAYRRLLTLFDISFCQNINNTEVERYEQFLYTEFGSREFTLDKRFINK